MGMRVRWYYNAKLVELYAEYEILSEIAQLATTRKSLCQRRDLSEIVLLASYH